LAFEAAFDAAMADAPWPGAVGVSGGSDSLALMHLLGDWAARHRRPAPAVLCVDHGLRPDSAKEARKVLAWAKKAGLKAQILAFNGKPPKSDIEAEAREARYRLMGAWAVEKGVAAVYVAHTADDQAETFLIRLGRGSGVDGLSAMRVLSPYPLAEFADLALVRPLLGRTRESLRATLARRGQDWIEDPMNADPRFVRARIRAAWPALEALGLSKARIADAASHLARAREALETVSAAVFERACRFDGEKAVIDPAALCGAPRELGLRVLARVLTLVSRNRYRPRFERLERLYALIAAGKLGSGRTLHGCRIGSAPRALAFFGKDSLLVSREAPRKAPSGRTKTGF
jgi:tRNA(Ile)-lysidine synthase